VPSTKRGCKGQEETLVEQAIRTLTNVKNRQKKQTDELLARHESKITTEYLANNSIITIIIEGDINPNLKGLVANKISAKYLRTTLVLSKDIFDDTVY
jgi:single-stranded DNA-specific DHH superfamily exonuclease